MRLQVFLSHNGVCSRRKAMDVVKSGRVSVNGKVVVEPSTDVEPLRDKITVDGALVEDKSFDYILLYKPLDVVTTKSDPHAKKTVYDLLPAYLRHVVPVGRLDKDTEGLLLLTNDGDLAFALTHPRFHIPKVYEAKLKGQLTSENKVKLEKGILLEGKKTLPAKIEHVHVLRDTTDLLITIHEGRKRQVRLMFAQVGLPVVSLTRLSQGPLNLQGMEPGSWRKLHQDEIRQLKQLIKQPTKK
jgi:23S rRNA pseudouridine2605 synthase